jgi:hypothetical protein
MSDGSVAPSEACQFCGRQPAIKIKLRRHVGMVILQKFYKFEGFVCKEHGQELAKSFLGKTLIQGWWGVISFFVNIFAVITDVIAVTKLSGLASPGPLDSPDPTS